MTKDGVKLPIKSSRSEVDAFLERVAATPAIKPAGQRGRLIFALDATASRAPTWDRACHIQSQMFVETAGLGGLDIQLVYYRGFRQFRAVPWTARSEELLRAMTAVTCLGGQTQIAKVLRHTLEETGRKRVDALVFVGDCVEEDVDRLCHIAGKLGMLHVPCFMFHEGDEPVARLAFRNIAELTGGAYCRFDAGSARQLRELLAAVAVYAAGGRRALEDYGARKGGAVLRITRQIR